MQTFLPYPDYRKSFECLDYKRLGKQRVEAKQILNALDKIVSAQEKRVGWGNHPAVKMWKGYEPALALYHNISILEWVRRGFNNSMPLIRIIEPIKMPPWFGDEKFHASHRSNLLRKDPEFYSKFNWIEDSGLPYVWGLIERKEPEIMETSIDIVQVG